MKQIVLEFPTKTIAAAAALRRHSEGVSVIAYETKQKTGLGILIERADRTISGFVYHSRLIQGRRRDMKFQAPTKEEAIEKALNAGRTVLYFESFAEFIEHAAKLNKL